MVEFWRALWQYQNTIYGLYIDCGENQGSAILIGANGVTDLGYMQADGSPDFLEKAC